MKTLLIMLFAMTMAARVWAKSDSPDYPKTLKLDAFELNLKGWGYRTATWLKVKVYRAALYVSDLQKDPLSTDDLQLLELTFVRSVSEKDVRSAWQEALAKNCESPCMVDAKLQEQFLGKIQAVKDGDTFKYRFGQRLEVTYPDGSKKIYDSAPFSHLILSTWIGKAPPTQELKKALLGE